MPNNTSNNTYLNAAQKLVSNTAKETVGAFTTGALTTGAKAAGALATVAAKAVAAAKAEKAAKAVAEEAIQPESLVINFTRSKDIEKIISVVQEQMISKIKAKKKDKDKEISIEGKKADLKKQINQIKLKCDLLSHCIEQDIKDISSSKSTELLLITKINELHLKIRLKLDTLEKDQEAINKLDSRAGTLVDSLDNFLSNEEKLMLNKDIALQEIQKFGKGEDSLTVEKFIDSESSVFDKLDLKIEEIKANIDKLIVELDTYNTPKKTEIDLLKKLAAAEAEATKPDEVNVEKEKAEIIKETKKISFLKEIEKKAQTWLIEAQQGGNSIKELMQEKKQTLIEKISKAKEIATSIEQNKQIINEDLNNLLKQYELDINHTEVTPGHIYLDDKGNYIFLDPWEILTKGTLKHLNRTNDDLIKEIKNKYLKSIVKSDKNLYTILKNIEKLTKDISENIARLTAKEAEAAAAATIQALIRKRSAIKTVEKMKTEAAAAAEITKTLQEVASEAKKTAEQIKAWAKKKEDDTVTNIITIADQLLNYANEALKLEDDDNIDSRETITAMHSDTSDMQKLINLQNNNLELIKNMESLRDTLENKLKEKAKAALAESGVKRTAKNSLLFETIRAFADEILKDTDKLDSGNDSLDIKLIRIIKEIEGLEEKKSRLQALKSELTTQPNSYLLQSNILLGGILLPISATIISNTVLGAAAAVITTGGILCAIQGAQPLGIGLIVTGLLIMAAVMLYKYLSQNNNDTHASSTALHT